MSIKHGIMYSGSSVCKD